MRPLHRLAPPAARPSDSNAVRHAPRPRQRAPLDWSGRGEAPTLDAIGYERSNQRRAALNRLVEIQREINGGREIDLVLAELAVIEAAIMTARATLQPPTLDERCDTFARPAGLSQSAAEGPGLEGGSARTGRAAAGAVPTAATRRPPSDSDYEISIGTDPKTGEVLFPVLRGGEVVLWSNDLAEAKRFVRLMPLYGLGDAQEPR